MTFEEKRRKWEHAIEDVLIEILKETTIDGVAFRSNTSLVVLEFSRLMEEVSAKRVNTNYRIRLGDIDE